MLFYVWKFQSTKFLCNVFVKYNPKRSSFRIGSFDQFVHVQSKWHHVIPMLGTCSRSRNLIIKRHLQQIFPFRKGRKNIQGTVVDFSMRQTSWFAFIGFSFSEFLGSTKFVLLSLGPDYNEQFISYKYTRHKRYSCYLNFFNIGIHSEAFFSEKGCS